MRNKDVNSLVQAIKNLPAGQRPDFVFIGDDKYLRRLATDPSLNDRLWQPILRIALNLQPPTPTGALISATAETVSTAAQTDAELAELVRIFSEDVGKLGEAAFKRLRTTDNLLARLV